MKRLLRRALVVLLALTLLFGSVPTLAETDDDSTQSSQVHFVLVIDCTGSMDEADSEGMSVAAAELFVDMIPMDNATISVICFGKQWKEDTYVFKCGKLEEMQPFLADGGEYSSLMRTDGRYIKALCELDSLGNVTERSEMKSEIEEADEEVSVDSMTVANTAMLAAIDLLKSANAEPNNACIVLMSDGRVQVGRRDAMDAVTKMNPYPSYVLELNYDQMNTPDTTARKQLENIAAKYDGDRQSNRYIEVQSAGDVIQAVSSVIGRFIDLQAVNPTKIEVVNGESEEYEFFVPQMASETNIVVTGEGFQSMEVTQPDGSSATYQTTSTVDPDNTFIRNENKYAVLKIKRPAFGTYKVKIYGESGTNIYIHAVSAKELNFVLRASGYEPDTKEYWLKNDEIIFTAALEYEGNIQSAGDYYAKNSALLYVKNLNTNQQLGPFEGVASENGYSWTIPLHDAGTLDVSAYMASPDFRGGGKTSNVLSYFVKNLELTLGEGQTLPLADTMHVNETTEPIDVSKLFYNPDDDDVIYAVTCKNEQSLTGDMAVNSPEQGVITLTMPSKEGVYQATLSAKDVNMQQPISVDFTVTVKNQPIKKIKDLSIDTIILSQPKFLGGKEAVTSYDITDYYIDLDGLPLSYELQTSKDNPDISIVRNGDVLTVSATKTGVEKTKLLMTDSSGDTEEVWLTVRCENWLTVLIKENLVWILIGIALIIIALILAGLRRVKGGWYVSITSPDSNMPPVRFSTLTSQKSLRKTKITLKKMLNSAVGLNDDYTISTPDLSYVRANPVMHGTLIANRVKITGIDYAHSHATVCLDGEEINKKRTKLVMKPKKHLELQYKNGDEEVLNVSLEME